MYMNFDESARLILLSPSSGELLVSLGLNLRNKNVMPYTNRFDATVNAYLK